jgi:sphingomyelin phosphodiesterase
MLCKVLLIYCMVAAVVGVKINSDRIEDLRKRIDDMKHQLHGDEAETRSEALKTLLGKIEHDKGSLLKGNLIEDDFLCATCVTAVDDFLNMRRLEALSQETIEMLVIEMCVDFEIASEEVCRGIIELNIPSIIYIVDNRPDLSADTVCKLLLNDGDCKDPFRDDSLDFTIDIDNGTLSVVSKTSDDEKQLPSEDLVIVHITDIHVDFNYTKGASADCNEFACCREMDDVNDTDPESNAGEWGDYRSCDTPWNAVVDAFNHIKRQHSVNIFLWHPNLARTV